MSFELMLHQRVGEHTIVLDAKSDAPITALVGPSGAGKTSVLNCVAGLAQPESGRIVAGGRVLFDSQKGIDLPPEQRHAGYVFQSGRLFPHMRVEGNLAYGEKLADPARRVVARTDLLELLGIGHLLQRWPATLSGGEVRRVAIGRALLGGPEFLLLDEPLTSLDAARGEEILRLVERIRDEIGLPILYVSHEMREVERLAANIVHLE